MNKTKIEWCDSTWNPVTGCKHDCPYCYARRIAERFGGHTLDGDTSTDSLFDEVLDEALYIERGNGKRTKAPYPYGFKPTFHRYRLYEPERKTKPQTIFVCSMADLFGAWVADEWIEEVFTVCEKAPQHRYLFLTKNPARYLELARAGKLPRRENMWYGSTTTTPDTPYFVAEGYNTFLSIEPLLEPFGDGKADAFTRAGEPRWIILGAMTGQGSEKHRPEKSWVDEITRAANVSEAAVFMKESLLPIMGEENMRREFPWDRRKSK